MGSSQPGPSIPVVPRPAATLVLARDGADGPEVLLIERPARGFFGGLWVFPGGAVDDSDHSGRAVRLIDLPADVDDAAFRVTALRETAEEVGLLLTVPATDTPVAVDGDNLYDLLEHEGKRLAGERLRLLSRWVTPDFAPVRFDTWFYVAVVDVDPVLTPRAGEVLDAVWIRPGQALEKFEAGAWALVTPTLHHLQWLAKFEDADSIWSAARSASPEPVAPTVERDGSEVRIRLPDIAELP